MTSFMLERFAAPSTRRGRRELAFADERAREQLAGRTVWSVTALPGGRVAARVLHAHLQDAADPRAGARPLPVSADGPLAQLAGRLEAMIVGPDPSASGLGRA